MEASPDHVAGELLFVVIGCTIEKEEHLSFVSVLLDDELLFEVMHEQGHHLMVGGSEG